MSMALFALLLLLVPGHLERARTAEANGDYRTMAAEAGAALEECRERGDRHCEAVALNLAGAAYLYRGDYRAALADFQESLELHRVLGEASQSVDRLSNIGSLQFYQGRYQGAWQSYQDAERLIAAHVNEPWAREANQAIKTNQAALLQRLGRDGPALLIYRELLNSSLLLKPGDEALLRANAGALYRRLGDPVKAEQFYRQALALLVREPRANIRLGVLKNMAIAEALDFGNLDEAARLFRQVLDAARAGHDKQETVQAALYLGETEFRAGRRESALRYWTEAAQLAEPEERWKALYGLARASSGAESTARLDEAVAVIESLQIGLRQSFLRGEFLADKRDVYDARIGRWLDSGAATPEILLEWIERTRGRSLDKAPKAPPPAEGTAVLSFWSSTTRWAWIWQTKTRSGFIHGRLPADAMQRLAALSASLANPGSQDWRAQAEYWSRQWLARLSVLQLPEVQRLVIVPDLLLAGVPVEVLPLPGAPTLAIEQYEISYLPTARVPLQTVPIRRLWPWVPVVLALGAVSETRPPLPGDERWTELPRSRQELDAIADAMPGRTGILAGADARKEALSAAWPILHLATHGVADLEDSRRSRLLFAGPEYLFLDEAADLRLKGVELVTLSACETARGRLVRGEGIDSFARAFLLAGVKSTLASLWSVNDSATAEFMRHFYHRLGRGDSRGDALRHAKLLFLHSQTRYSHPAFWSAFVLYGNSAEPVGVPPRWGFMALVGMLLIAVAAWYRRQA